MTVSAAAARGDRLTVTGELGDQLFGSDKMKSAFKDIKPKDRTCQSSSGTSCSTW